MMEQKRNMKTIQIQFEQLPIDELRPDPANPRRISDQELETLTRSIREFGLIDPIIARREDKMVIGGHQRLLAARKLGYKTVPVVLVDLTADQAHLLNIALNRISGSFDQELLARLLGELKQVPEIDLSLSGFGDEELKKLLKSLDAREKRERLENFDYEETLKAAQNTPVAKRGDIWLLGDHRLMCGDSTSPEDVARLMNNEKASLLATDPPYLVDYSGGNHPASKGNKGNPARDKNWDEYVDPKASVEFYRKFLALGLQYLKPNSAVYQWHAHRRQALVEQAWTACGLLVHQQIIWVKSRGVLTHSHYLWAHEPCFYGWVEGQPPSKKPPSNERTVWQLDQQGSSMNIHPTQKPVELFMRPIEFHTEMGDICYEPFLGSGTQIIAAEKSSRRCFAMEQEPRFVDVAVMRWEAFSGEKAKKADEVK
jgi:DNA modification methylase